MNNKSIVKLLMLFHFFCISIVMWAQHPLLNAGPMLGYSEMREVMLWVQTTNEASVFIEYAPQAAPGSKQRTNTVQTKKEGAFTAKLIADVVQPGQRYNYTLYINGKAVKLPYTTEFQAQQIWKWRGNPPEFSMLTGSCAYINQAEFDRPGKPYGADYRIFENMAKHKADLMVWLGDNLYLREPDWNSWTGIVGRYSHDRAISELQPFLASTHHYAIWDDHDYGPNDCDKSFYNKNQTLKAFELFWGNPTFGVGNIEGAISSFQWGDADFFLLDNRWYRDADNLLKENKTILGEEQIQWLFDNLATSTNTFKIVAMGGQFLSTAPVYETYSANGFEKERQRIIDFIHKHKIKNVIFITGDVHFTEMSVLKKENLPTIYDLTFSAMTAGPNTQGDTWKNEYRIAGTVVTERNFGKISFKGPSKKRQLVVGCYNTDNVLKWEKIIDQE